MPTQLLHVDRVARRALHGALTAHNQRAVGERAAANPASNTITQARKEMEKEKNHFCFEKSEARACRIDMERGSRVHLWTVSHFVASCSRSFGHTHVHSCTHKTRHEFQSIRADFSQHRFYN